MREAWTQPVCNVFVMSMWSGLRCLSIAPTWCSGLFFVRCCWLACFIFESQPCFIDVCQSCSTSEKSRLLEVTDVKELVFHLRVFRPQPIAAQLPSASHQFHSSSMWWSKEGPIGVLKGLATMARRWGSSRAARRSWLMVRFQRQQPGRTWEDCWHDENYDWWERRREWTTDIWTGWKKEKHAHLQPTPLKAGSVWGKLWGDDDVGKNLTGQTSTWVRYWIWRPHGCPDCIRKIAQLQRQRPGRSLRPTMVGNPSLRSAFRLQLRGRWWNEKCFPPRVVPQRSFFWFQCQLFTIYNESKKKDGLDSQWVLRNQWFWFDTCQMASIKAGCKSFPRLSVHVSHGCCAHETT